MMDILIVVHIKTNFDAWKEVFDSDPGGRVNFVDESRTRLGKVDDQTAMVQLFDVDMEQMGKAMNDPNSPAAPLIAEHVVRHDVYKVESMAPPAE